MWGTRNDILHARDAAGRKLSKVEQLTADIRLQYELDDDTLLARDQHLLASPLHQILASTMPEQRAWLQVIFSARTAFEIHWDIMNMDNI